MYHIVFFFLVSVKQVQQTQKMKCERNQYYLYAFLLLSCKGKSKLAQIVYLRWIDDLYITNFHLYRGALHPQKINGMNESPHPFHHFIFLRLTLPKTLIGIAKIHFRCMLICFFMHSYVQLSHHISRHMCGIHTIFRESNKNSIMASTPFKAHAQCMVLIQLSDQKIMYTTRHPSESKMEATI